MKVTITKEAPKNEDGKKRMTLGQLGHFIAEAEATLPPETEVQVSTSGLGWLKVITVEGEPNFRGPHIPLPPIPPLTEEQSWEDIN